ncbi:hypothetical protein FSP39_004394 [Pinctada imbricata]|uniref:NlpC/P60 domain-containing protein n=1 Tax=Pinctada imbricata TaxID=66713 RepID=A0AA88YT40_PINIB|nr:hypothetical protein FSP39_004394 [Pinctada imbricata]
MRKRRKKKQRDPQAMLELRKKFLNQAKKYFGVPYAKKYWSPDTEEHYSKIFLDCCGLVRQVMRDLEKDFGFRLGPWNQAYMYDTLPITLTSEKDMKPGDLVFMSGVYPSPKARQQKHFMTHVEIWAGDGCKTIGARWNNGKVQVWDHYKFEAKSFHSAQYYFKSIDTWLMGVCKSFCKQHKWKRRKFNPSKKSVFSLKQNQETTKKVTENSLEVVGRGEYKTDIDTNVASDADGDFPEADIEDAVEDCDEVGNEDFGSSSEDEGDEDNQQVDSGSEDGTESESEDINALPENMEALECQSSLSTRVSAVNNKNSCAIENPDGSGSPYKKDEALHIRKSHGLEMSIQKSIFINGNSATEGNETSSLCTMTANCTIKGQGSRSSSSLKTEGKPSMKTAPTCNSDPGLNKLKFK